MAGWHGLDKDCGAYRPDDSVMVLVDRKELAVLRRDAERLKQLWDALGATNQTQAMQALRKLRAERTAQPTDGKAVER